MKTAEPKKASNLHSRARRTKSTEEQRMHFPKIAALVKKERAAKGVSLRDLAIKTKLSHQQILRVEHGICSVESALVVLKALDVPRAMRAKVVTSEMYALAMAS